MKNIKFIYLKITLLLAFIVTVTISCEREVSDEVEFASYSNTGEIFIDGFMGGLDYFPFGDSFAEAFSVDNDEKYEGSASMRFDIPVFGVGYGGATFPSKGPRDLSGYDALTFWAKASQGADINEIGFGINGDTNNKYRVTMQNLPLTTQWKKYIIPIPDPSRLFEEKGMFWYAEGAATASEEGGYTFWIDELQFEKLGTIAQPQPAIFFGEDIPEVTAYIGDEGHITGLTQTFNLGSGINETVLAAPSYFSFSSSDIEVARVSELGIISIVGAGSATITATLGGVKAAGSLKLKVGEGSFDFAPTPPVRNPADVISIFSDAYTNVNALNFAVFNDDNVQITVGEYDGNKVAWYNNLVFVGLGWNGNVNVSNMTHLHLDVKVSESSNPKLTVELIDFGANDSEGGGDDTGGGSIIATSNLIEGTWVGIDIPINGFTQSTGGGFAGSPNLNNIARVVLVSNGSSFIVDNIYFYK